jgi:hypothetical protein
LYHPLIKPAIVALSISFFIGAFVHMELGEFQIQTKLRSLFSCGISCPINSCTISCYNFTLDRILIKAAFIRPLGIE